MLVIRHKQIEAIREGRLIEFEDRAILFVAEVFPEELTKMGHGRAREVVHSATAAAASYFIEREQDVGLFVALHFGLGADFLERDDTLWVRRILEDRRKNGQQKIEAVYQGLEDAAGESGQSAG